MRVLLALVLMVLFARPVFALDWQRAFYVSSQGMVVIGHVVDTATTQRCIGAGRCRETNPWLLHFNNPVGFGLAKGTVGAGGLWAADRIDNKWIAGLLNYGIGLAFLGIGIHNERQARR